MLGKERERVKWRERERLQTMVCKVSWKSGPEDLWTLVLTGLDSHLTQENREYLHYMVANIKEHSS